MFVHSSRKSAGDVRYLVLLCIHTAEPLSNRFADVRLLYISTTVTFWCGSRHCRCSCKPLINKVGKDNLIGTLIILKEIIDNEGNKKGAINFGG